MIAIFTLFYGNLNSGLSKMSKKLGGADISGKIAVAALNGLGRLPISTAGKLGRFTGHVAWRLAPTSRKVTLKNLELCFPNMSQKQRDELAKESLLETLTTAFEMAPSWVQPVEKLVSKITHADNEVLLSEA
ncbi:MAG: hypothetical protein MI808_19320, partial [Pseudomonadales bacterium]|nr:hypothetical protein [Pseudomonadales bacterium]